MHACAGGRSLRAINTSISVEKVINSTSFLSFICWYYTQTEESLLLILLLAVGRGKGVKFICSAGRRSLVSYTFLLTMH